MQNQTSDPSKNSEFVPFNASSVARNIADEIIKNAIALGLRSDDAVGKIILDYINSERSDSLTIRFIKDVFEKKPDFKEKINKYLQGKQDYIKKNVYLGENSDQIKLDHVMKFLEEELVTYAGKRPQIERKLFSIKKIIPKLESNHRMSSSFFSFLLDVRYYKNHFIYSLKSFKTKNKNHSVISSSTKNLIVDLIEISKHPLTDKIIKDEIWEAINLIMSEKEFFKDDKDDKDDKEYEDTCKEVHNEFLNVIKKEISLFKDKEDCTYIQRLEETLTVTNDSKTGVSDRIFNYIKELQKILSEPQIAKKDANTKKIKLFLKKQQERIINQFLDPDENTCHFYFDRSETSSKEIKEIVSTYLHSKIHIKLKKYEVQYKSSVRYKLKDIIKYDLTSTITGKYEPLTLVNVVLSKTKLMADGVDFNFTDFFGQINSTIKQIIENKSANTSSTLLILLKNLRRETFKTLVQLNQRYGLYNNELEIVRKYNNRAFDAVLEKRFDRHFKNNAFTDFLSRNLPWVKEKMANQKERIDKIKFCLKKENFDNSIKNFSEESYYTSLITFLKNELSDIEKNNRDGTYKLLKKMQYNIISRYILKPNSVHKLKFSRMQLAQIIAHTEDALQKKKLLNIYANLEKENEQNNEVNIHQIETIYGDKQDDLYPQQKYEIDKVDKEINLLKARLQFGTQLSGDEEARYNFLLNKKQVLSDKNQYVLYTKCRKKVISLILMGYVMLSDLPVIKQTSKSSMIQAAQNAVSHVAPAHVNTAINTLTGAIIKDIESQHYETIQSFANYSNGVNDIDLVAESIAIGIAEQYTFCETFKNLDPGNAESVAVAVSDRLKEALSQSKRNDTEQTNNPDLVASIVQHLHESEQKHGFLFFEKELKPNGVNNHPNTMKKEKITVEGILNRTGIYIADEKGECTFYASAHANIPLYGFRKGTLSEVKNPDGGNRIPEINPLNLKSCYPQAADQSNISTMMNTISEAEKNNANQQKILTTSEPSVPPETSLRLKLL